MASEAGSKRKREAAAEAKAGVGADKAPAIHRTGLPAAVLAAFDTWFAGETDLGVFLPPTWRAEPRVAEFVKSTSFMALDQGLRDKYAGPDAIFPSFDRLFRALELCPDPAAVRLIMPGSEPNFWGGSDGLAFSHTEPANFGSIKTLIAVRDAEAATKAEAGPKPKQDARASRHDLTGWAEQGILLLNCRMSSKASHGKGGGKSHADIGWEALVQVLVRAVLDATARAGRRVAAVSFCKEATDLLTACLPEDFIWWRHMLPYAAEEDKRQAQFQEVVAEGPFKAINLVLATMWGGAPIVW